RSTTRACGSCHQGTVAAGAARSPEHADCKSCHPPHDPKGARERCVGCHPKIELAHGGDAHGKGGGCVTCHDPHPSLPMSVDAAQHKPCAECHASIAGDSGAHAKGVACTACHLPHTFSPSAPGNPTCERCHRE